MSDALVLAVAAQVHKDWEPGGQARAPITLGASMKAATVRAETAIRGFVLIFFPN